MLLDPNITYISLQQLTEVRRKSAMKILEFSGHFIIIMMMITMMTVTVMIIIIIIIIIMLFLMLMMVMVNMTMIVIVKMIITIVNDFLLSQCLFYSVTCFTMLML